MNIKKITLAALTYFILSFLIQGILAFVIAGEYFSGIAILRNPPIMYLALPQTVISGIAFAILYPFTKFKGSSVAKGIKFGLLVGFIMIPFIALDLPSRFIIPSVGKWVLIQGILGMLFYVSSGILTGLIYGKSK